MAILLCPSMACADVSALGEQTRVLETAGADIFHMDISDGRFLPEMALGLHDVRCVRRHTQACVDVHLYVYEPLRHIEAYARAGADLLYIHPQSCADPMRCLVAVRMQGRKAGLSLLPGTQLETVWELLHASDALMINTALGGAPGRAFWTPILDKVRAALAFRKAHRLSFPILVDGAITQQRMEQLAGWGVDGFVLGTQALFTGPEVDLAARMAELRRIVPCEA